MVAPRKVGLGTLVMVAVVLDRSTPESFAILRGGDGQAEMRARLPSALAGDFDYFLKIRPATSTTSTASVASGSSHLPGVRQTRTFFVMKEVVDNAPLNFETLFSGRRHRGVSNT